MPEDTGVGTGDGSASSPYQIYTAEELNAIRGGITGYEDWDLGDSYILMADIDLAGYGSWDPIGTVGTGLEFAGSFDGNDHSILSLTIDSTTSTVGLFGSIGAAGDVRSLTITGADVTGRSNVGILAGRNYGTVSGAYTNGSVSSTGGGYVGGLLGLNEGTVSLSGSAAGVLSSSTNNGQYAGGFVGYSSGTIDSCYATGSVEGYDNNVGGFVGSFKGTISDSYSTGDTVGYDDYIGGFSGKNEGGYLTSCYSSGSVSTSASGSPVIKGFTGEGIESARNVACYYNSATSGYEDSYAADIDLTDENSFSGFDFTSVWDIESGGTPFLQALGY